MAVGTTITDHQPERTTRYLRFLVTDTDGVTGLLNLSTVLTTLTLDLYERSTSTIINSRTAQNIKGANGCTLYDTTQTFTDADGVSHSYNVELRLDAADMAMISTRAGEVHVAEFHATWGSPLKTLHHAITFIVENFTKVTA